MSIYTGVHEGNHEYGEFIINYDFAATVNGYRHLNMLSAKREDYPGVCYSVRIENIASAAGPNNKNYEVIFNNGQWEVFTGDYAEGYAEPPARRLACLPDLRELVSVKTFPSAEFIAARTFCVQNSDPAAGEISWDPSENAVMSGKTFLRLISYAVSLVRNSAGTPESYLAEVRGEGLSSTDGLDLDEKIGGFPTETAAQNACQDHYNEFAKNYYSGQSFTKKLRFLRPGGKVKRRTVTQALAAATHYWVENDLPTKSHYLAHPERGAQEIMIFPSAGGYDAYLINNLRLHYFKYEYLHVEYPEVTCLGSNTALAPLKQLCEEVFAAEVRHKPLVGDAHSQNEVANLVKSRTGELMRGMRDFILPPTPESAPPRQTSK